MDILIDLSILNNRNSGPGQVALNYGQYFRDCYEPMRDESITLLVPSDYVGQFGNKVKYVKAKSIYKLLPFLVRLKRYDVWHTVYQSSGFMPWGKNNVLTIHDFNPCYGDNERKAKKYLKNVRFKIDLADTVAAISYYTESEVQNYSPTNKPVHVIPNGLERIDLLPETKPQAIEEPFIFTIGEVKRGKNFGVMLNIMKLLPEYHLYIAGNDKTEYAETLRKKIANENINNVHLMGTVSGEEKCWMYRNCTAFVFPSIFEGFGLPVLEAMLYRKPVISSRGASLAEICMNHATFFPPEFEPQESADTIKKAIAETTAKKIDEAFDYASSFTWEKHIKRYLRLYRSKPFEAQ